MIASSTTVHFLAPSLTGKSSLTAGMYAKFRTKEAGFRLFAVNDKYQTDNDRDLDLENAWRMIKLRGEYPVHNTEKDLTTYYFEFQHNDKPLIRFDWLDYRGAVVDSRSSAGDYSKFQGQINKVQANGCIFYGVSAELLLKPIENDRQLLDDVKEKARIYRMDQLTKDISSSSPAVFVITKSDTPGFDRRSPAGVVNDLRQLFPGWFMPGNKRISMVAPVSVVDGRNLESPFIFAAWATLLREHATARRLLTAARSSLARKYDGGILHSVLKGASGVFDGEYSRNVAALSKKVDDARSRVNALQASLTPLLAKLCPMIIYMDGKEMTDREKNDVYSFSLG